MTDDTIKTESPLPCGLIVGASTHTPCDAEESIFHATSPALGQPIQHRCWYSHALPRRSSHGEWVCGLVTGLVAGLVVSY